MTPKEVYEECRKLAEEIGPRAEVSAYVTMFARGKVWLNIAPLLYPAKTDFSTTKEDTWEAAFAAGRALWAKKNELHASNVVRDIALAIVRITYDMGECTDQALRAEFDAADIRRYSERALERANAMAEGAPFSIVATEAANAA